MIYLDVFYVVEMQPLKSGPGLEKSGPGLKKWAKMGKNGVKWLPQTPHMYTTNLFFNSVFTKYIELQFFAISS